MPLKKLVKKKEKNAVLVENKEEKNGSNFIFTKGRYCRISFEPKGLSIAPKTLANFLERMTQLYEQGATVRRIGQYVRNWWRWVRAGVVISDEPSHIRARINSH